MRPAVYKGSFIVKRTKLIVLALSVPAAAAAAWGAMYLAQRDPLASLSAEELQRLEDGYLVIEPDLTAGSLAVITVAIILWWLFEVVAWLRERRRQYVRRRNGVQVSH